MKKIIVLLLTAVLALSLYACSGGEEEKTLNSTKASKAEATVKQPEKTEEKGQNGEQTSARTNASENNGPDTSETKNISSTTGAVIIGSENFEISENDEYCLIVGMGGCTDKELVIPTHINGKPVKYIDEEAFRNSDITSVAVPWTVNKIDEDAFAECKNLSSVTLSEGLQYISLNAFYECESLKSITLPASLFSAARGAFSFCSSLEEATALGCPVIGDRSFEDCASLKTFTLIGSLEAYSAFIGSNAFSGCTSLETLKLGEGIEEIKDWSFSNCSALKEIYLPKTLKKIDSCAFRNCGQLKVYYAGSEDEWKEIKIGNYNDPLQNAEFVYNHK